MDANLGRYVTGTIDSSCIRLPDGTMASSYGRKPQTVIAAPDDCPNHLLLVKTPECDRRLTSMCPVA